MENVECWYVQSQLIQLLSMIPVPDYFIAFQFSAAHIGTSKIVWNQN